MEALNLSPRHRNKRKKIVSSPPPPEIAQITSAAIAASLVIQTSVHFNLTLAEEPGAYLSLETFFCINVMTSESFLAYFQYRTEAGTDLLFGWVLVCCSVGVDAYKSFAFCLHGAEIGFLFVIYIFIHWLKEHWLISGNEKQKSKPNPKQQYYTAWH